MSKAACALHINYEPGCWECDDANPSTEAEPERICGRTEASCQQDRQDMAEAIAERDALTSELTEARRQLGEVTRERDAYRDNRYAGPWEPVACHHNGEGYSRAGAAFVGLRRDGRYEWNCPGFRSALVATADEAKAAADAHLIAAGWYLADAPKPETPGDDGR